MEHLDRQTNSLNALLDVASLLGAKIELDELLPLIVSKTTQVMEAERSTLFLYDPETKELWSKVAEGIGEKILRIPIGKGIAGEVGATLKGLNIPDAYKDKRFNPEFDKHTQFHTHSILCMPLLNSGKQLIGVLQIINKKNKQIFDSQDEKLLKGIAIQAAVALERATLIASYVEREKFQESLNLAHEIQMGIVPKKFPPFPDKKNIEIYAAIESAKDVGGDLYNFFLIDTNHLGLVIGDVSGKGVPAALYMAITTTLMTAHQGDSISPEKVLAKVNKALCHNNEQCMFTTLFYAILDLTTGALTYSNAGHNPPYLIRKNGEIEQLPLKHSLALGVYEQFAFEQETLTLNKEEMLYLYTDGVNEAMDKEGHEFSLKRLETLIKENYQLSPELLVNKTLKAVHLFANGTEQSDDLTLLVIKYRG